MTTTPPSLTRFSYLFGVIRQAFERESFIGRFPLQLETSTGIAPFNYFKMQIDRDCKISIGLTEFPVHGCPHRVGLRRTIGAKLFPLVMSLSSRGYLNLDFSLFVIFHIIRYIYILPFNFFSCLLLLIPLPDIFCCVPSVIFAELCARALLQQNGPCLL